MLKEVNSEGKVLVVLCERKLLGRVLDNRGFYVDPKYFEGVDTDVSFALGIANQADFLTILGTSIIEQAVKAGLLDPTAVKLIGKIKYAEVYRV
jgi:hypothetical protein